MVRHIFLRVCVVCVVFGGVVRKESVEGGWHSPVVREHKSKGDACTAVASSGVDLLDEVRHFTERGVLPADERSSE